MITKYTTEDERKLLELITRTQEDSSVLPITKSIRCIASYAAYEQSKMIGFIVAWKSKIHPFCTYFRCISSSNHNRLSAELMEHLESELSESDYPLQTSVDKRSVLVNYYTTRFNLVRKTYMPTIILSETPRYSFEGHEKIVSIDKIKTNTSIIEKLTTIVKWIYEETHQVNPVAELNLSYWKNMIFSEDLIEEGSYLYLDHNDKILAYSLLHRSENKDTVELGWKGSISTFEINKIYLLVDLQIDYAKRRGFQHMEGEFDDTDVYAMGVLNHFSLPRKTVLFTFQKQKKGDDI